MRGKWHILLFAGALGCAGMAGYCHQQAARLGDQADLEQQRSVSSGSSFVDTFSGEFVSSQLGQLDRRRQLIQSASHWSEGMLFSLVGVVLLAFAGYTVRSVSSAIEEVGATHEPIPVPQRP